MFSIPIINKLLYWSCNNHELMNRLPPPPPSNKYIHWAVLTFVQPELCNCKHVTCMDCRELHLIKCGELRILFYLGQFCVSFLLYQ